MPGFDTKVHTRVAEMIGKGIKIKVDLRDSAVRERKLYRLAGAATRVLFRACNNSVTNLLRALNERVYNTMQDGELKPTIKPAPGVFAARLQHFADKLKAVTPILLPLSYDQFCDRYSGRRKQLYQRAVESLHVSGVCKKDAGLKGFIKFEKGNITDKADACPRLISPRDPRYNIEVGRYISHCEKPLFKAIAKVFGHTTVYKGLDAYKSAASLRKAWESYSNPVAVGLDASRFDQHVSSDALRWEHARWLNFVPQSERAQLKKLLSWQIENKGKAYVDDGTITYEVDGCRMSGDMNTSSGNCLIMCAMIHSYMQHCSIKEFNLANNGDDCVVIFEGKRLTEFSAGLDAWFVEMGFTMKVEEPVYEFEHIEFCQTKPVLSSAGWVMVRNPHVAIAKDAIANCDISTEKVFRTWCDAMHHGGTALTAGVPVWPQFYSMFPRQTSTGQATHAQTIGGLTESGMWRLRGNLEYRRLEVGPAQRESFWKAFGLLPDEQLLLELQYARSTFEYSKPTRQLVMEPVSVLDAHNPKLLGNTYGEYFEY